MTFSFDEKDPLEAARAERVVTDMLKRGYLLFAKVEGKLVRVTEFDSKRREYILADGPTVGPGSPTEETVPKLKRGKGGRVKANGTSVTGIAPTAGG